MIEKLKKIRIDIISLVLVLICSYFLDIKKLIITIYFLLIYTFIKISKNKPWVSQKIFLFLSYTGLFLSYYGYYLYESLPGHGIDYIGQAIVSGLFVKLGRILLLTCPIIILMIDNKKYIFRIIVILGLSVYLTYFYNSFT